MHLKLLESELNSMPKRVLYFNVEKKRDEEEEKENQEKIFYNLKQHLSEQVKGTTKELNSIAKNVDIAYMLFCYDVPVEKGKDGKPTKRHTIMYWRNYEQTLMQILSKVF